MLNQKVEESSEEESEEEFEDETPVTTNQMSALLMDSSSSDSDSSSADSNKDTEQGSDSEHEALRNDTSIKARGKWGRGGIKKKGGKGKASEAFDPTDAEKRPEDDDFYRELAAITNEMGAGVATATVAQSVTGIDTGTGTGTGTAPCMNRNSADHVMLLNRLFAITDMADLDVGKMMRRRFGAVGTDAGEDQPGQGGINAVNMAGASKTQQKLFRLMEKRHRLISQKQRPGFRAAGPVGSMGSGGGAGGTLYGRKWVFGSPPRPFSRTPGVKAGGYAMVKADTPAGIRLSTENPATDTVTDTVVGIPPWEQEYYQNTQWYRYQWSSEYTQLQERYRDVQLSGDPNALFRFIAQYPYHAEAALQLSVVFARTGSMDRAAELVRHCINHLEYAFEPSFVPWSQYTDTSSSSNSSSSSSSSSSSGSVMSGYARMDPACEGNALLFQALSKHLQISFMLGCPAVALNLALVVLSLDPLRDSMHMLLQLDYLLLSCGRHAALEAWYDHGLLGYPHDFSATPAPVKMSKCTVGESLPNWGYTLALSRFVQHEQEQEKAEAEGSESPGGAVLGTNGGPIYRASHSVSLVAAVSRWPFVLTALLSHLGTGAAGSMGLSWERITTHPLFTNMDDCLDGPGGGGGQVLRHITEAFCMRSSALWKRDAVLQWVYDTVSNYLFGVKYASSGGGGADALPLAGVSLEAKLADLRAEYARVGALSEVAKYGQAELEALLEEFPRLPPDINPLDPALIDPRNSLTQIMNETRAREQAAGARAEGGGQRGRARQLEQMRALQEQLQLQGAGGEEDPAVQEQLMQFFRQQTGGAAGGVGNVDLDAPMMQLFLQTLFPWSQVGGNGVGDGNGGPPAARGVDIGVGDMDFGAILAQLGLPAVPPDQNHNAAGDDRGVVPPLVADDEAHGYGEDEGEGRLGDDYGNYAYDSDSDSDSSNGLV
mgnify:CR=1 FL=1